MKNHNGMRPQDIVILMAILASSKLRNAWQDSNEGDTLRDLPMIKKGVFIPANNKELAYVLKISESEVSESLKRSVYSGLLMDNKLKIINKKALLDFLIYGIKYVFPARPEGVVRGIATAHSAEPLKSKIISDEIFVWEYSNGNTRGQMIKPLYTSVPQIIEGNPNIYELLALIDAIRTGTARVVSLAAKELEDRFLNSW